MAIAAQRGRPRSEQADRAILEAALAVLRRGGYEEMSIEAVAAEAGVGKPTIYRRYRNKAQLAIAAVATIPPPIPARSTGDARADLVEQLRRVARGIDEAGGLVLGSLIAEGGDPELVALHRECIIRPRAEYSRQILRGARDRGEIDPATDVDLVMEMLVGSILTRRLNGRVPPADWAERSVGLIFDGMARAKRAGPGPDPR